MKLPIAAASSIIACLLILHGFFQFCWHPLDFS